MSEPTSIDLDPTLRRDAGATLHARFFLRRGETLGRYTIIDLVGTGGMGAVYRARDAELDRVVALKVLRPVGDETSLAERARFLAEAQTLARMSHVNIVTVFDVGEVDGQMFIAMELIDGVSLREWQNERPRGWREVRDVFVAAGRGLEAAHRGGIIHRDFKPHNVIIAGERVVVVDFGLARAGAAGGDATTLTPSSDLSLTATGAIVGTPAYMSPEQHAGAPLTARSDIFSFCVALHEALFGRRPFVAPTVAGLARAVRVRPLVFPSGRRVPRFLMALLRRGLAVEPDERFASMTEVVRALGQDPTRRALRVIAAGALAALLATGVSLATRDPPSPCLGADRALDEIWGEPARRRLAAAFEAVGPGVAEPGQRTLRGLDRYAQGWRTMRLEACRDTLERGVQSAALMDLRMACLDRKAGAMSSLAQVLSTEMDAELAGQAGLLVSALPDLRACADPRTLAERVPLPDEPGPRARVLELERAVDEADASLAAGKVSRALAQSPLVTVAAGEAHAPLRARALLFEGRLVSVVHAEAGPPVLESALRAAAAARDDHLAAEVWLAMLASPGTDPASPGWLAAEVSVQRGGGDARQLADVKRLRGVRLLELSRFSEATPHLARAVAILRARPEPRDASLAAALLALSRAQWGHADFAGGLRSAQEATNIYEETLGETHYLVGNALMAVGNNAMEVNAQEVAQQAYARARDIFSRALGPGHARTLSAAQNLALLLRRRGHLPEALAIYRETMPLLERRLGPDSAGMVRPLHNVAAAAREAGSFEEAERLGRRALALGRKTLEADAPLLVTLEADLAYTRLRLGRHEEALEGYRSALRDLDALPDGHHDTRIVVLIGMGQALAGLGRLPEAIRRIEQGLALCDLERFGPDTLARVRDRSARILMRVPAQRRRAIEVARHAIQSYEEAGLTLERDQLASWIATQE